jgi:WD40 repeat protein
MIAHHGPISGVAAGGAYVATAGYDNAVILWNAARRESIARGTHDHLANHCALHPGGTLLATAGSDYTARLWALPEVALQVVFHDHEDDVEMVAFSPDGELLATASRDHRARLFRLDGTLVRRLTGHTSDVISVAWSPNGSALLTSGDDGTIRTWDVATGRELNVVSMDDCEADTVVALDDESFAVGNDRGEVTIVRGERRQTIAAHRAGVKRLAYDAASRRLVSSAYDRTINVWAVDGATAAFVSTTEAPAAVWLRSCAFAGQHTLVLSTFGGGYARLDLATGSWDTSLVRATSGANGAAAVGGTIYTVGDFGQVRAGDEVVTELGSLCNFLGTIGDRLLAGGQLGILFDALTGERLHQHRSPLNCSTTLTLPDGRERMFVGTYTGEALVVDWTRDGGIAVREGVALHRNAIKGLANDGAGVFSVCATGAAAYHDAVSLREIWNDPQAHDRIANGAAALGAGRFASVSRDLCLRIWERDGSVVVVPTPHRHSIKSVAASPDGRRIATGAYDGHVAIYDVERARWTTTVRPTTSGISCIVYDSAAGSFVATSYDGGVFRL